MNFAVFFSVIFSLPLVCPRMFFPQHPVVACRNIMTRIINKYHCMYINILYIHKNTHCGVMVSGICEWCHCRRLMSWVAFHRKHTETPWGRRIRNDEFWKIENPTCRNIPKQPEEKSLFNRSSRHVKTASRFHTGEVKDLQGLETALKRYIETWSIHQN